MRHHRISSSLLVALGLLALLAMPLTASAGGPAKKAPAAATSKAAGKGKVDPARSAAAKKGWETRRINQKAEANWASRVNKNPAIDKPGAKEAFLKRSVASQRGWQKRQTVASAPKTKSSKKLATGKAKDKKVAAKKDDKASGKKNGKKKADKKKVAKAKAGKKGSKGGAAAADEAGMIANAGAGAKDLQNAVAKFDEAQFAAGEGRARDAAIAQMEGHDLMAQSAFDAADAYEQAGRTAEADKLNAFGEQHLAQADALEKKIDEQDKAATAESAPQKRPGRIRRFFASLNPFNKNK